MLVCKFIKETYFLQTIFVFAQKVIQVISKIFSSKQKSTLGDFQNVVEGLSSQSIIQRYSDEIIVPRGNIRNSPIRRVQTVEEKQFMSFAYNPRSDSSSHLINLLVGQVLEKLIRRKLLDIHVPEVTQRFYLRWDLQKSIFL